MRYIASIVLGVGVCVAGAGTNGVVMTDAPVHDARARATAAAATQTPDTVTDYQPRYVSFFLPNETFLMVDTAKGLVYTARQSRSTLNVWRQYNLHTVARELDKEPRIAVDSPTLADAIIHGRYVVRHRGDIIFFIDTLTGRTWGARHREGVLDTWKCYDPRGQ